jgi:hypothetical protein
MDTHRIGATAMPTIDCPWCTGDLTPDAAFSSLHCDDCQVSVDVAPDPVEPRLDLAA